MYVTTILRQMFFFVDLSVMMQNAKFQWIVSVHMLSET